MSNINFKALNIFTIFGATGLVILILGYIFYCYDKKKRKNCISMTHGQVIDYRFYHQAPEPIAEYEVAGIKYKKARKFRAVIQIGKGFSLKNLNPNSYDIYVDEKDVIHIKTGVLFNMKRAARELYPLGSSINIFYNPDNPKQAYVERIPEGNSIIGILFMYVGLGFIVLGTIIFMIFK